MAAPSLAVAHPATSTRLISCGDGDCLSIRGHRTSRDALIRVNGHAVAADGGASWRVTLPLATVRDWSAPVARTVQVAVEGPAGTRGDDETVRLPVGLLARRIELASLTVRAR